MGEGDVFIDVFLTIIGFWISEKENGTVRPLYYTYSLMRNY